jgi:Flp pilus assembly protein TadG
MWHPRRILQKISANAAVWERARRVWKDERGANMVESAIATAVVMMLLFGVFDFSLAFYTYHYVSDAAREGSRWAMVRGSKSCAQTPNLSDCGATADEIAAYVKGLGYPGIDSADYMDVSVSTGAATNSTASNGTSTTVWSTTTANDMTYNVPGDVVTVQVVYHFPMSLPFWKQETINVGSTSSMVISQ